jgi:membrane-associated phospholipid phosphatase
LRARWPSSRLALILTGLLGYHVIYWTYHNLKSWDVFLAPRDDLLRGFDRALFFGHTPAVLLHNLLGVGVADPVLVTIYRLFSPVTMFAIVAFVAFAPTVKHAYAALTSMAWIWVLGVASYYAIPSLGPFASDPGTFVNLPHSAETTGQAHLLADRQYLLEHPHAHDAFAAISAFASLHTGVTATVVLLTWYFGFRRLSAVLAVFLVLVMVATIYLGYHFVADDIAGLVLAFVAVQLGLGTVYGRNRGAVAWTRRS